MRFVYLQSRNKMKIKRTEEKLIYILYFLQSKLVKSKTNYSQKVNPDILKEQTIATLFYREFK